MATGCFRLPFIMGVPPSPPDTEWQYWGSTGSNGIYDAMLTTIINSDLEMDKISIGREFSLGINNGRLYIIGKVIIDIYYEWTQVGSDTDWDECSAGLSHGMAIRAGRLYGIGTGTFGELGDNLTTSSATITQIGSDTNWEKIACGSSFTMAIKGGQLYGTGSNSTGRTGLGTATGQTNQFTIANSDTTWTAIDSSIQHSFGINGGFVYSWGVNSAGRTGSGSTIGSTLSPTQRGTDTWSEIALGAIHTLLINTSGELYYCGQQSQGRLGNGTLSTGNNATITQVGSDTNWEKIAAYKHDVQFFSEWSAALKGGKLYATGINKFGQLNQPTLTANSGTFVQIGTHDDYIELVAGLGFGLAKRDVISTPDCPTNIDGGNASSTMDGFTIEGGNASSTMDGCIIDGENA